jgi:hypothetical protein
MASFQDDPFLQSFFYCDDPALSFSVEELEWLCEPQYAPKISDTRHSNLVQTTIQRAQAIKQLLAEKLVTLFETDNEEATQDLWKVWQYKKQYQTERPSPPRQPTWARLETIYNWHVWWFTGIRLFLLRVGRIAAICGRAFLPMFFRIFGLSYGVTFLIDLLVVLKVTFNPKAIRADLRKGKGLWKPLRRRFKLILKQGNRPYRMMNDCVWFVVNVTLLATTGPLFLVISPFLNLTCFIFDAGHESFWLGWETKKYNRLLKKLKQHIKRHYQDIDKLSPTSPEYQIKYQTHQQAIETLEKIHTAVKNSRSSMLKRRAWITFWTIVLLVGMAMIYFPPTTGPGVLLAGAVLALISGSIFIGLGRRLYLTVEKPIKSILVERHKQTPTHTPTLGIYYLLQYKSKPLFTLAGQFDKTKTKSALIKSRMNNGPSSRGFFSAVAAMFRRRSIASANLTDPLLQASV